MKDHFMRTLSSNHSGIPTEAQYQQAMTKCLHEIFDEHAVAHPDALALFCGNQKLSYGELRIRARKLAGEIVALGATHETPVGIYMGRSVEAIISMLAILYAGAAYLPLDPLFPSERIRFMLKDSNASILLTDSQEYETAKEYAEAILLVDAISDCTESLVGSTCFNTATPESLAYIMYTSGSTGTPKGVEILHKGVVRLVYGDYANFGPGEVFLHMSTPSFDASTFEIWGALLHASPLVIIPERIPGIVDIRRAIQKGKVTTALMTTSYFNTIIDEAPESLQGLRQLLVVGEALSISHIRIALSALPDTTIINGYGPTENSAATCCYTIPRDLDQDLKSIPIGRPIRGTTVYILNDQGHPVPEGVEGELYTGGEGVARGYLGRPELNQTRFVVDPFSNTPHARMYGTGDIVRRRTDGNIEFVGRVDDQVKIRGFRVEPNEVQALIIQHPSVRNALVLAMTDFVGTKHLVAYIVPENETHYNEEAVRKSIEDRLPEYMQPSFYLKLASIPLKVNGKTDREALPSPWGLGGQLREDDYASSLELSIARLWFAVLGSVVIKRDLNVFESGAKSIHALRVHQRLQLLLNKQFPFTALFEFPTIQSLAVYLGSERDVDDVVDKEQESAFDAVKIRARKQADSLARLQSRKKARK